MSGGPVVVVAGALGGFVALHSRPPLTGHTIGPSFDPAHPAAVLSPAFADVLGHRFVQEDAGETVPAACVALPQGQFRDVTSCPVTGTPASMYASGFDWHAPFGQSPMSIVWRCGPVAQPLMPE